MTFKSVAGLAIAGVTMSVVVAKQAPQSPLGVGARATATPAVKSAATTACVWKNAPIVGGGFVSGLVLHPAERGLMYARADIGGAHR